MEYKSRRKFSSGHRYRTGSYIDKNIVALLTLDTHIYAIPHKADSRLYITFATSILCADLSSFKIRETMAMR